MLAGSIGAAIWFVPAIIGINPYDELWKCAPFAFTCSIVLCSGRLIQDRRATHLGSVCFWGTLVTLADLSLPLFHQFLPTLYWSSIQPQRNFFYSAATILSGAFVGAAISSIYGTKLAYSISLGILGESVFIVWSVVDEMAGRDLYAVWVMVMILGNIAMPVCPTFLAEKAHRDSLRTSEVRFP